MKHEYIGRMKSNWLWAEHPTLKKSSRVYLLPTENFMCIIQWFILSNLSSQKYTPIPGTDVPQPDSTPLRIYRLSCSLSWYSMQYFFRLRNSARSMSKCMFPRNSLVIPCTSSLVVVKDLLKGVGRLPAK